MMEEHWINASRYTQVEDRVNKKPSEYLPNKEVTYRHQGNGYYYHPTLPEGLYLPAQGQGMGQTPRYLNEDLLVDTSNGKVIGYGRPFSDFEQYETQTQTVENTMTVLYKVEEETATSFATKLATNSKGLWVLEELWTGRVFTTTTDKIEGVMPYTITVKLLGSKTRYSYFSEKGKFKEGDMFIFNDNLCHVTEVDTRSLSATKIFAPKIKVLTETVS